MTIGGIVREHEDDLKLPLAQRYVHQIRMDGSMKIGVTMNSELAALIHDPGVRYLDGDITFKRTKGMGGRDLVSLLRASFTKDAFTQSFDAFFSAVKQVTGKPVRFKAFHPQGDLYSVLFDMEAAQVQGFGASTDELVGVVGQETVDYLNRFRGLSDPPDIDNWHQFCRTHQNKKLRDRHTQKIRYPGLLPGFNESLSSFPLGFWQQSPSHTNLFESTHVATNRATNSNLLPLESLRTYTRMRRNVTRSNKRRSYREDHAIFNDSIMAAQAALAALNGNKKALYLKTLKSPKKDLGRVPRNNDVDAPESDVEHPAGYASAVPSSPFSSPRSRFSTPQPEVEYNQNSGVTDTSAADSFELTEFELGELWTHCHELFAVPNAFDSDTPFIADPELADPDTSSPAGSPATQAAATPAHIAPAPAVPLQAAVKHRRADEVDARDIIDGHRPRKVFVQAGRRSPREYALGAINRRSRRPNPIKVVEPPSPMEDIVHFSQLPRFRRISDSGRQADKWPGGGGPGKMPGLNRANGTNASVAE
ncbi:hypothetical protein DFH06DRAFT_1130465 [Mycena polygramma]|nr:hypothetical protein DFH06DRAFT_1130465 [Mycena polygramma]